MNKSPKLIAAVAYFISPGRNALFPNDASNVSS
jgi:hypothetical protein